MSREVLLEATERLAQSGVIKDIDAARIALEAGLPLASFRQEFQDDAALLEALHGHHVASLVREIGQVMSTMPAGRRRLERAVEAFWSGCIARIPLRRLIKQGRIKVDLDASVQRRNRAFELLLQPELKEIGDPSPMESARLLRALIEEVAQAEFESGEPQPLLRAGLWRMFDSNIRPPSSTVG